MEGDLIEIKDDDDSEIPSEDELAVVNKKLAEVIRKIRKLEAEKRSLERRASQLKEMKQKEECDKLLGQDWDRKKFDWSERLDLARKEVFSLDRYRPDQLSVMNATMSGHDCILIMPTGGGKSLTYQLPAVISDGVTLVVSPLLSLMEDQLMALKRLGIQAEMLTGTTNGETKKRVMKDMLDPSSSLKLLYVTPEKCSKSKQFMAK
jgi:ATP-dependent DNA helicase Q1